MNRRNFIKKAAGGIGFAGVGVLAGCASATKEKNHCGKEINNGSAVAWAEGKADPSSKSDRMTVEVKFKDKNNNTIATQKETRMGVQEGYTWDYFIVWSGPEKKVEQVYDCDVSVTQKGRE